MTKPQTPQPLEVLKTDVNPQELAVQYIKHELIKLFPGKDLAPIIDNLPQSLGEKDFWQLLAGLSEGYKLKWIYRILTNNIYSWTLERIKLDDIKMTGMSPFMDQVLAEADWQPSKFALVWKQHPEYTEAPEAQGIKPYPERDHFPIMLHEKKGTLRVFDGMRRVCVAAIENKPDLLAWVGRITNPGGQMMINGDKVLFLRVLYDEAPEKDPELLQAIKVAMRAYIKYYRNGRQLVESYMHSWKQKPELAKIAEEILSE